MKKVCIIFLIASVLISNGYVNITLKDFLIFSGCLLISHAIVFFIDYYNYYKQRREYDYLILALQKCIERQNIQ